MANDSILTTTKKMCGLAEDYTAFDIDIITHINSVLTTLHDLGIGPEDGYMIEDKDPVWGDFLGDAKHMNAVKTYVYLKVRMFFDPPATSYAIAAMQDQIKELEWRLNVRREATDWIDPDPAENPYIAVIDGGSSSDD